MAVIPLLTEASSELLTESSAVILIESSDDPGDSTDTGGETEETAYQLWSRTRHRPIKYQRGVRRRR